MKVETQWQCKGGPSPEGILEDNGGPSPDVVLGGEWGLLLGGEGVFEDEGVFNLKEVMWVKGFFS